MVLNGNECSNALYNANHRELHVSTLMGFCSHITGYFAQHSNSKFCLCSPFSFRRKLRLRADSVVLSVCANERK